MIIKNRIIYSRKNYYLKLGLMLGLIIGVILTVSIIKLAANISARLTAEKSSDSIIPPYYDINVFKKPKIVESGDIAKHGLTISAKMKIPIIMYHYVEYVQDIGDVIRKRLSINPYVFERQLQTIKANNMQTYFVKDIPDILDGKIDYSSNSAVLTFDDGYEDFYTVAFPLLIKYQIKSTVYIVNDFIGRKGFLNEDQIRELINSDLVEIGSHTLDHFYLKDAQEKIALRQIIESKSELEKTFGIEVKTFAYPYGAFDEKTLEMVKAATFSAAVSVIPGTFQSKDNLFYLSRLRAGMFTEQNMISILEKNSK